MPVTLSVANKPIILSVVMLSVVMLGVIMLSVVMLKKICHMQFATIACNSYCIHTMLTILQYVSIGVRFFTPVVSYMYKKHIKLAPMNNTVKILKTLLIAVAK